MSVPFYAYQPDMWKSVAEGPMLSIRGLPTKSLLLGVNISLLIKFNANKTHPPAYALPSPS